MTMLQSDGTAAAAPEGVVKDTTTQGFVKDVIEVQAPTGAGGLAEWCGPCKQLTPVLEKVVKAAKGKVKLVKMDIDKHPSIPGQLGIQSIPAVFAFVNGQPVDGFLGALPESQVTAFIERVTGPHRRRGKGRVEGGRHRARRGRRRRRRRPLRAGAGARRGNIAALAGLARAYLQTGAVEQAKQTLALVPEAKRNDAAVAAARAALELIEQAKSVGPVGELEQKVATNPLDHQARFDLAVALNSKGKRQEAVDQLWKSSSATANGTTTARASSWSSCSTPGARPTRRRPGANGYPRSCFLDVATAVDLFVRS